MKLVNRFKLPISGASITSVSNEIHSMLSQLTIREHDLLIMHFGLGMEPVPPKIIASMFGVGTERIRQIKEGALNKLKRRFGNKLKSLW